MKAGRWLLWTGIGAMWWMSGIASANYIPSALEMQAFPALARVGEAVLIRFEVTENRYHQSLGGFFFVIQYPKEVTSFPELAEVISNADLGPEVYIAGGPYTPPSSGSASNQRLSAIGVVGSHFGTGMGLTVEFPIQINPGVSPHPLPLVLRGEGSDKSGDFFEADLVGGAVFVTGDGGPGDVDGDGKVTINDAQWALSLLLGTATGSPGVLHSADVWPLNGPDGKLTLADARQIVVLALVE